MEHEYAAGNANPYDVAFDSYETVCKRVAAFVGAAPDEIALTESTTDGITRERDEAEATRIADKYEPGETL